MIFNLDEVAAFPSEDLQSIEAQIKLVLRGRKREALARFREANPVIGMAIKTDDSEFFGYYELGQALPNWALYFMDRRPDEVFEVVKIYNQELKDLLLESNNSREHEHVFFNANNNTASGEEWVDADYDLVV